MTAEDAAALVAALAACLAAGARTLAGCMQAMGLGVDATDGLLALALARAAQPATLAQGGLGIRGWWGGCGCACLHRRVGAALLPGSGVHF